VITGNPEDIELGEHYLFKLYFDESILTMKWLENCAVATNQRILILDSTLQCLK
jgi:hypothetical protein